jgi:hypothetical protein
MKRCRFALQAAFFAPQAAGPVAVHPGPGLLPLATEYP